MKNRSKGDYPSVTIVVLNYNGRDIIAKCLESLRKTEYPNLRTFVFDNGSTDDSRKIISGRFPDVRMFSTEKNLGVTKGMNLALSKALESSDADYIVFYTNDVQVNEPSWLSSLVDMAEKDKGIRHRRMQAPLSGRDHPARGDGVLAGQAEGKGAGWLEVLLGRGHGRRDRRMFPAYPVPAHENRRRRRGFLSLLLRGRGFLLPGQESRIQNQVCRQRGPDAL